MTAGTFPAPRKRKARKQRVPELMGVTEVCRELGVASGNLDRVAGLPEPVMKLAAGRLWRADEIRDFAAHRKSRS